MAAMLMTTPVRWRVRDDELRGHHDRPIRPWQPGIDFRICAQDLFVAHVEAARTMSVSVSSFVLLTICTTPTTSSSGATSKRCVATGSGSEGAARRRWGWSRLGVLHPIEEGACGREGTQAGRYSGSNLRDLHGPEL